jgi:hypothetical protein
MERTPAVASRAGEAGWVFPVVLLSIVFLAALSSLLTAKTATLGKIYHDGVRSAALHEALRAEISSRQALPEGCSPQRSSALGSRGEWIVCSESPPRFATIPALTAPIPAPDFDLLLSDATPCKGSKEVVAQGRFASPVAPFTCVVKDELSTGIVAMENLALDSAIFESKKDAPVPMIVSPGYLTIGGMLRTSSDLVVVVGGNVRIEHLQGAGQLPVRVTVISSRGDIEVGRVSGALSLLVAGRATLHVAPTPFLPPFPLPRERTPTILGLAPSRWGWN